MRNYEIVFMVHPDQSEKVQNLIDLYSNFIKDKHGQIHRIENWGRRPLAYSINKIYKAYYVLMNIQTSPIIMNELRKKIQFDNFIIRSMIINIKDPITEASSMLTIKDERYNHTVVNTFTNKNKNYSLL